MGQHNAAGPAGNALRSRVEKSRQMLEKSLFFCRTWMQDKKDHLTDWKGGLFSYDMVYVAEVAVKSANPLETAYTR